LKLIPQDESHDVAPLSFDREANRALWSPLCDTVRNNSVDADGRQRVRRRSKSPKQKHRRVRRNRLAMHHPASPTRVYTGIDWLSLGPLREAIRSHVSGRPLPVWNRSRRLVNDGEGSLFGQFMINGV
jgi:hypothetical protein